MVKTPAEVPYVLLGYKAPTLKTATEAWEPYALDVLEGILDGGNSSRIGLIWCAAPRSPPAASAGYNLTSRLEELFLLAGNPAPGHQRRTGTGPARRVAKLREEPVSPRTGAVVAQAAAADVYQRDSLFYQGMRLGMLETVGLGWNRLDDYVQRLRAVTPEQVREVARKYLSDDRLTVAALEPLPLDGRRPLPRPALGWIMRSAKSPPISILSQPLSPGKERRTEILPTMSSLKPSLSGLLATRVAVRLQPGSGHPEIQNWHTANGVPVYFIAARELPMVDAQILFRAGSVRDGERPGLAQRPTACWKKAPATGRPTPSPTVWTRWVPNWPPVRGATRLR